MRFGVHSGAAGITNGFSKTSVAVLIARAAFPRQGFIGALLCTYCTDCVCSFFLSTPRDMYVREPPPRVKLSHTLKNMKGRLQRSGQGCVGPKHREALRRKARWCFFFRSQEVPTPRYFQKYFDRRSSQSGCELLVSTTRKPSGHSLISW